MRVQATTVSSCILFGACSFGPSSAPPRVYEINDFWKNAWDAGDHTHLLEINADEKREGNLLPADALAMVSKTCEATVALTEADVDLRHNTWMHVDYYDGSAEELETYTFRCPEPGKDVQ